MVETKGRRGRKPANPPQSFSEMVDAGKKRKTSKAYREESSEFVDMSIRSLVKMSAEQLAEVADKRGTILLENTQDLIKSTIIYMEACAESAVVPTLLGLATSIGYSIDAFLFFKKTHPEHETTKWLNLCKDKFANMTVIAGEKNFGNSIMYMFVLKSMYGFVEKTAFEVSTPTDPLGGQQSPSDIAAKYQYLQESSEDSL